MGHSSNCPTCELYKAENERLWHELDVVLKMIEKFAEQTEVTYGQGQQETTNERGEVQR